VQRFPHSDVPARQAFRLKIELPAVDPGAARLESLAVGAYDDGILMDESSGPA
jgi:hypothetical protein